MHSATHLEHSGLVRFRGVCAQTRVAIEMYSRTSSVKCHVFERPPKQATKP